MTITFNDGDTETVNLKKVGKALTVDLGKMPKASLEHVFAYGLRQILNDAMASAKTEAEAEGAARKRLDNLMAGTLRASPMREGNPVAKRALELALAKLKASPKFTEWMKSQGLKGSDKQVTEAALANARKLTAVEGNPFTKQAEIDVAAQKALDVEVELEF